ncbi:AraC family transcriptional regulator [Niallia alba]|uniref:helix-turn-helix domain-containing protein n=1 Tax=Niallia alba TaxID=2729105 RepID=UPI0039A2A914
MNYFEFTVPPLPHYILSGEDTYFPNQSHPNRKNIEVFDLIVVTKGELFIGEETFTWRISAGQFLILRPDKYHYSKIPCQSETHFYWLHFQSSGEWQEVEDYTNISQSHSQFPMLPFDHTDLFRITLPRFNTLTNMPSFLEIIQKLISLSSQPSLEVRWREQTIFQELLFQLHGTQKQKINSAVLQLAENTISYLQKNYQKTITNDLLKNELHFHPVYITRCMKQVYECTPMEYLKKYRIEQAKIFLLNTDATISEISEMVGFSSTPYFTRIFSGCTKISPLKFRKQYR